jgi:hypothetical protein
MSCVIQLTYVFLLSASLPAVLRMLQSRWRRRCTPTRLSLPRSPVGPSRPPDPTLTCLLPAFAIPRLAAASCCGVYIDSEGTCGGKPFQAGAQLHALSTNKTCSGVVVCKFGSTSAQQSTKLVWRYLKVSICPVPGLFMCEFCALVSTALTCS